MRTAELLLDARRQLGAAGVGSPRVDAELLLAHVLRVVRSRLVLVPDVPDDAAARFRALVMRRAAREPLQHITGTAPFRHVELAVGPGVFVPRPETELLVDAALPALRGLERPRVVDLCAGSGALAVSIAHEVPHAEVHAVERDPAALVWLRRNASGTRVEVVSGDVADARLLAALVGTVDAVVCNPPYVPSATPVEPEVRADPDAAVFAGTDGLDLVPAVLACARRLLRPGGSFAMEHDDTHGDSVPALLRHGGWLDVTAHRDLAGRPRYVTATAP